MYICIILHIRLIVMSFNTLARLLCLRLKRAEQVYSEAIKILDLHMDKCKYSL